MGQVYKLTFANGKAYIGLSYTKRKIALKAMGNKRALGHKRKR